MNVLIIEDEPLAVQRLETLVGDIHPGANIVSRIDSVKKSVQWFKSNPSPDLVLMDIQLADGISFQIFEQCEVNAPVIFTTAYDEYALKAFKVNSIDYILKPVDKTDLANALRKLESLKNAQPTQTQLMQSITQAMQMLTRKYKERFVIKVGEHLKTVDTKSILYFYSQEKTTFCHTSDNRNYILDYTLEQLETLVDPTDYFRANRKYLVGNNSIQDIISYTNSRLRLVLKNSQDNDIIVARERVQDFRLWLDR
ncbi:MAG TPA: LytTR family DNA-binding domain-containing protein [Cyclobacteriaceae bacterium]|nr:LytTR family DNA-binding domain-containing protein [Cyclobacteriaceae bacterium]HMV10671.1 LytTR family DNA-binding domain-containing protein [Cyclobacteriaceae bacterium]HMV90897.1 LytTR family DNA-binding domain-containing protein [Cyclobacteriaceae bacterium]HMX02532.1 LytTR family DNA-binding domain-containing protein [Cyclobacteriaceae bacterium]HMX50752.1 LytTR family DNA-binding domain-containing protein [Cyclobacteriaceae bacterium]